MRFTSSLILIITAISAGVIEREYSLHYSLFFTLFSFSERNGTGGNLLKPCLDSTNEAQCVKNGSLRIFLFCRVGNECSLRFSVLQNFLFLFELQPVHISFQYSPEKLWLKKKGGEDIRGAVILCSCLREGVFYHQSCS